MFIVMSIKGEGKNTEDFLEIADLFQVWRLNLIFTEYLRYI